LTNKSDIHAVNQLQYLSANKNLYFSRWEDAERIKFEIGALSKERSQAIPTPTIYVRDDTAPGAGAFLRNPETGKFEKYRRGTPEEEMAAKETIIVNSVNHPQPTVWPSKLRFRNKAKTFYNGSAVGHVRKAEWLQGR
jgi:hypothetical protein